MKNKKINFMPFIIFCMFLAVISTLIIISNLMQLNYDTSKDIIMLIVIVILLIICTIAINKPQQ